MDHIECGSRNAEIGIERIGKLECGTENGEVGKVSIEEKTCREHRYLRILIDSTLKSVGGK